METIFIYRNKQDVDNPPYGITADTFNKAIELAKNLGFTKFVFALGWDKERLEAYRPKRSNSNKFTRKLS
jgi:hypothetical protein